MLLNNCLKHVLNVGVNNITVPVELSKIGHKFGVFGGGEVNLSKQNNFFSK